MIKARLGTIEFIGNVTVPMNANSVLVIVGPNNSGKSASLTAIRAHLDGSHKPQSSLVGFSLIKETPLDEIKSMLAHVKNENDTYLIPGFNFQESHLEYWWEKSDSDIGHFLVSQILCELTTKSRLADCEPAPAFDARTEYSATHPFQRMYLEESVEKRASDIFRAAFKRDLMVHHAAGNIIPVYIGKKPALESGEDRISRPYLKRVEALERIESQGDGIKSFASIIGRVITESRPIQLIDEPEAFLPPPIARLAAKSIIENSGDRQTIIATHSSDVLRGLLSDASGRVSVIRLTRPVGGAQAHHLEASQIAALWRDPILRFSSILDGLFHEGVIITEADADCRFYEALSFASVPDKDRPDIHYAYTGGKDRMPTVIQALVALKVPVATIVDFDVLNNDQPLRRIVEAHGGCWNDVEPDWREVKAAVEQHTAFVDGDQFRIRVTQELNLYGAGTVVPKATLKKIQNLTRSASAWGQAKSSGLAAIPRGDATMKAMILLSTLRELGIFVTPNGEMEGFYPSIGGHGPRWVAAVLEKDLTTDSQLESARQHVKQVNAFLRSRS